MLKLYHFLGSYLDNWETTSLYKLINNIYKQKDIETNKELVPYEVLGARDLRVVPCVGRRVRRRLVARELCEVLLKPRLPRQDLLRQQVLLV